MPSRILAGLLVCLFLASPFPAAEAQTYAEGRALEFRTDLPWARLQLLGDENVSGVSPLRIPGALDGDYWLRASGDDVETQLGRVRVRVDESGSRIVSYGRGPFRSTFLQSFVPGLPQYMTEEKKKGLLLGASGLTTLILAGAAQRDVWDAELVEEDRQRQNELASNELEEILTRVELSVAREDVTYSKERRDLFLAATGAIWSVSLIDALILRPGFAVTRADEQSLSLSMQPKRRVDAMVRSLVFPGLGQDYNGHNSRAFLFAAAGIFSGAWFLHSQTEYNEAVHDYNLERIRFNGATDVDERDQRLLALESLGSDVDDRERSRDNAILLMGAAWAVGVLDAALSFGRPWGENRPQRSGFGMVADPAQRSLAAQLRF